jgi:SAM-dependent methyltransferase
VFREIYRVLKPGGRFAVSDLVLLEELPAEVAKSVSAYVGCIAGASLMHDYVRMALKAGLTDLSIPQIAHGKKLAEAVAPGEACCGSPVASAAANAVASIKLHGSKR